MVRYYIDTCIWRDHTENRSDTHRPIGEFARRFIEYVIREGHTVMWSDILEWELRNSPAHTYPQYLRERLTQRHLLHEVCTTAQQIEEAVEISETRHVPASDALHAILARENEAVLVTRDAHFQELRDIALPRLPEEEA